MGVRVAEYLGVRVDSCKKIKPIRVSKEKSTSSKPTLPCPFRDDKCSKASRGDKPICSVRDEGSNVLWIVCEHRLCATSPKARGLVEHQQEILLQVAEVVFRERLEKKDVLVKREVPIRVSDDSDYSADYVMWRRNPRANSPQFVERPVVLEMQGGGETTNTGDLTQHVTLWEQSAKPTNEGLAAVVARTSPLVTNAWRRQQEQFLVKGNVAMLSGGRMVFCLGRMIYDYLTPRVKQTVELADLRGSNWTLALLAFDEDLSPNASPASCAPHSIPLALDKSRMLFTNYASFVQALTNQAQASASLFTERYFDLTGDDITF